MTYRAVVFDLDGTLLDTLEDLADALNRVMETMHLPTHPTEAYRRFVGNGATMLVSRALPPDRRNEPLMAQCLEAFREEYGRNWNTKTRPYSGVPELLDALTAKGIPMAVLTNKPHEFAQLCVQEFLPRWKFVVTLGQRDGIPVKPDPSGPREVVRALGVPASECLYLGDSNVDMETAINADMLPVGASWGFRSTQELLETGAAQVINHPTELLRLLP